MLFFGEYHLILLGALFFLHHWKINMEPKNHPIEEENHLPNLHFWGSMLIFGAVRVTEIPKKKLNVPTMLWHSVMRVPSRLFWQPGDLDEAHYIELCYRERLVKKNAFVNNLDLLNTPLKTKECPLKINGCKMYSVLKFSSLFRGHISFRFFLAKCHGCFMKDSEIHLLMNLVSTWIASFLKCLPSWGRLWNVLDNYSAQPGMTTPIPSMGLVYLPTWNPYKSTVHVGKYTVRPMDPMTNYHVLPERSRELQT